MAEHLPSMGKVLGSVSSETAKVITIIFKICRYWSTGNEAGVICVRKCSPQERGKLGATRGDSQVLVLAHETSMALQPPTNP